MTRDLGLAAMSLVGVILIVFVGSGLVQKEIERRTVLTVLAKPVRRPEFLIGKYLGLLAMVTVIFLAMLALLMVVLWLRERHIEPAVLVAAGFTLGELAVMTAVAVAFSSFVSPVLSGVFTLALFVAGHFSADLLQFAEKMEASPLAGLARAVYLLLPHLDTFNLRAEAAYGVIPDLSVVLNALVYTVLYSMALVAAGCGIFSQREFR